MIHNLNQVNFQGFGVIPPERISAAQHADALGSRRVLPLSAESAAIYRAQSDTWLRCQEGATVLSVSQDGNRFTHYYLDKPVYVHAGVYFCLSPFLGKSTAEIAAKLPPLEAGQWDSQQNFRVEHNLQVTALYTFFYQEKEQGFLFPGEAHPMVELTYVDQGSLHSVADGQDLLLEQGDLVLYAPNQWHMQYADTAVAPQFVTISFDADGQGLEQLYRRKWKIPPKAAPLLQQMLLEQEHPDSRTNDMLLHLLSILLLTLLRETAAPAEKAGSVRSLHNENEIIRRAQQYILANIRQKLTVPQVAGQVDVSASYLTALFRKNLQISPGEYIRRMKLQESKQMIRENNLNFTEIAAALQYSTVHHFSRQFKEKFGITPTEYARSVRG